MSANLPEFNRGAVRPVECLRGGWNLIKDQYWLFLGMAFVALFIGSAVPLGILLGPMMCGLYMAFFRRQRGEPVTFELLFKGFDFFGDSLVATLVQVVPMFLVVVPTYIISVAYLTISMNQPGRRGQPPDMFPFIVFFIVIFVVIMTVSLIIHMFFAFTYPLIVDRRLSGINAVKTSIKAAAANLGGVLGLALLTMLLGIAGVLLCYVGAIFVLPINFAAWSIAYRQVFSAQDVPPAPPVF
ncbi:MAG TPA: hypothetical protein VGC66_19900 [Pyrinomonadaceae bacterium]|jgi:hypothetical protein